MVAAIISRFDLGGQCMILSTTDVIQGAIVESYLGVVTAEVVYGSNALRDFFAGIRDIIGGRTGAYERVFQQGQRDALAELEKRAAQLGADAVVGIELDTGTIQIDQAGVLLLITASGTAIKLRSA
jgi:uncharacterized protein YbjQ (UPF0145 family)